MRTEGLFARAAVVVVCGAACAACAERPLDGLASTDGPPRDLATPADATPSDLSSPVDRTPPPDAAGMPGACYQQGVATLPYATIPDLVKLLAGRWAACGPDRVYLGGHYGVEVTADGHWYSLDLDAQGAIVRSDPFGSVDYGEIPNNPPGARIEVTFNWDATLLPPNESRFLGGFMAFEGGPLRFSFQGPPNFTALYTTLDGR